MSIYASLSLTHTHSHIPTHAPPAPQQVFQSRTDLATAARPIEVPEAIPTEFLAVPRAAAADADVVAAELRAAPRDAGTSRGTSAAGAFPAERGGAEYAETETLFSLTCLLQTRVKTRRLKSVIDAYEPLMSRPPCTAPSTWGGGETLGVASLH